MTKMDGLHPIPAAQRTEPLVTNWCLRRIELSGDPPATLRAMIDEGLLDATALHRIIEEADPFLLCRVFSALPAECFDPVIETMIAKWPQWTGRALFLAGQIIARRRPQQAQAFFAPFARWEELDGPHRQHALAVVSILVHLPGNVACAWFEDFWRHYAPRIENLEHDVIELGIVMASAATMDHPAIEALLRAYLSAGRREPPEEYLQRLEHLFAIREASRFEYHFLEYPPATDDPSISKALDRIFVSASAAAAVPKLAGDLKHRRYAPIGAFLTRTRQIAPDDCWFATLARLAGDPAFVNGLHKKKHRPQFFQTVLAFALALHRRKSPLLEDLTAEEIVALVQLDLPWAEDPELLSQIAVELNHRDRERVATLLAAALTRNLGYQAAEHVIQIMAEIDAAGVVPPLVRCLADPEAMESHGESVVDALKAHGEGALSHLAEVIDQVQDDLLIWTLELLESIATAEAISLVEARFDRLWKAEREGLLAVLEALPAGPWQDRLRPKVDRGQHDIDRTYTLLTLLNGRMTEPDHQRLQALGKDARQRAAQSEAVLSGESDPLVQEELTLKLRCPSCGDDSYYPVRRIFINPGAEGKPYVADELFCVECGQTGVFDLTPEGHQTVTGAMIGLMMARNKDQEKAEALLEKSPFRFLTAMILGKKMDIGEGVRRYQQQLAAEPENVVAIIGLANIYRHTDRQASAKELLQRAIAIDPKYIESFYILARMAFLDGRPDEARKILENGLPYLNEARIRDGHDGSSTLDMVHTYLGFYEALKSPDGASDRDPFEDGSAPEDGPDSPKKKIGRNDPCPCGSGKKYKKCCLQHGQSL